MARRYVRLEQAVKVQEVKEVQAEAIEKTTVIDNYEGQKLQVYGRIMERVQGDPDKEDLLQDAAIKALESQKEFNGLDHYQNWLKNRINRRTIIVNQARERLVSLTDKPEGWIEAEARALVYIPKDYGLYKWIINQTDSNGKRIWSRRQLRVLSRTYLTGKTALEIAGETGLTVDQIKKIRKSIDRRLLSLPIRANISDWGYCGSGATRADIWAQTDIVPSKITFNKETSNRTLDVTDSLRCQKAHAEKLAKQGAPLPDYLSDGKRPYPYQGPCSFGLVPHRPIKASTAKLIQAEADRQVRVRAVKFLDYRLLQSERLQAMSA